MTVENLLQSIISFIAKRRPDLSLPEIHTGIDDLLKNKYQILPENSNSRSFQSTRLKETLLFTPEFAKHIYQKLIHASKAELKTTIYEHSIHNFIKAGIERAQSYESVLELINALSGGISKATSDHLKATLQDILNEVNEYIIITHPAINKIIVTKINESQAEYQHFKSIRNREAAWIFCCGINAVLQLPLNIAWSAISVGSLGLVPVVAGICSQDENYVRTCYFSCWWYKNACFFPIEQKYSREIATHNPCLPMNATAQHIKRFNSASASLQEADDLRNRYLRSSITMQNPAVARMR